MAAYAALVTLSKAIHQILPYEQHYSFLCDTQKMQSLLDTVNSLQEFIEDVSGKSSDGVDELESRIRDVAYRLEDIVEPILVHSLAKEYQNEVNSRLSIQDANSQLISSIRNTNLEASIGEANTQLSIQEAILESILVQSSPDQECENEVNSQLSIQEANTQLPLAAEGRAISFFRELFNKLCVACFACTGKDTEVVLEDNVTQVSDQTISHESTAPSNYVESETEASLDDNVTQVSDQTTGHESTYGLGSAEASTSIISVSAESETETSLDDILGWCLDQDLKSKAKYSHLPLIARAAAAFENCIKEAELLFEEATETMKKALDNKLVISGTSFVPHDIPTTSLSRGLKDDLQQILGQINRKQRALEVIPITGMGGIGKTTLARAVYNHHRKQGHFDLVLWATVSQQYNVKEILRVLCPENAESDAIVSVHKRLKGWRYLIFLDDVWDEKVWDGVRNAFPDDRNYSRVILTTRLSNVATYASSSSTRAHKMQLLNEDQSWDLLRETVYGHGVGCLGEFEDMGRMVSGSCKGLPLALVVIGGLLKRNKTRDYWKEVARSTTAAAAAYDDPLLRILSLSYTNLPPHLKPCFLYFGMFREDAEIPAKELVRLWCAEGFLKPRESKTMEEVGEECLEELVERNLVLVMKKRYGGKIKTSSIHDVLRDLCLNQARNEKFLHPYAFHTRRVSSRYLSGVSRISYNSPIRTIRTDKWSGTIPQFKLVRVLGAVPLSSSAFINSVRMTNLRYLHLHNEDWDDKESLIMVPKSISKLRNLETLFVSGDSYFRNDEKYELILPVEIWEMPRLRHLLVSEGGIIKLPPFPASDDSSTECLSLQTLRGLLNFVDFSPRLIQKLQQNLKKLKIKYDCGEEFGLENLVNLHHLEHLTILSHDYYNAPRVRNIGFPINLKKLSLYDTELPWEKMTVIGDSLKHLQVLKLRMNAFVGGRVWEPIEGGFPQLKYLMMEWLWYLEEWRAESRHFPSLVKLVIFRCINLKEVPAEIGNIDTLEKLIVKKYEDDDDVRRGFEKSVQRIKEEQQRVGNDSLQVIIMSENQHFFKGQIV